jgi:hypothetical protein
MRKIFEQIRGLMDWNNQPLGDKEKNGKYAEKKVDLYNAEVMPSGFFDTYQKILFRPRKTIEQVKNN